MPLLVGSDRVFTGKGDALLPVSVEEEKPYLMIDRDKTGFTISSNLPKITEQLEYVVEKDPTHYVVYKLDWDEKDIFQNLLTLQH